MKRLAIPLIALGLAAYGAHAGPQQPTQADLVCKDLRAMRPTLKAPIAVTYRDPSGNTAFRCKALAGGEHMAAVDAEAIALEGKPNPFKP